MKKYLFVIFIISALIPQTVSAQTLPFSQELHQIIERARFRLGPLRLYPILQLRDVGYDDNVYRQLEDRNPVGDYTATISPSASVYLLYKNSLILAFTENPEYIFFSNQRQQRRWTNSWSSELKALLFRRFVLSGRYINSERRYRTTSEINVRANVRHNTYGTSILYETARATSLGLSIDVSKITYEDVTIPGQEIRLSRALNREERVFNGEVNYEISPESYLFFQGGYTDYTFESREVQFKNSSSFQLMSGIRFPLLGSIRGTLSLGLRSFSPKTWGKKGFFGLVGNTSLEFRLRRFVFRVRYNRDTRFTYWTDNVFFVEDRYGAGISYYITQFIRLDYNFNYGDGAYPEPFLIRRPDEGYEEIKRKDRYITNDIGIVFRVFRTVGVGLNVNFWERKSNLATEKRKNRFIGGYITYDF